MLLIAMAGMALAALLAPFVLRLARERRLARIRADWGNPVHRLRRLDGMAASHRSRIGTTSPGVLVTGSNMSGKSTFLRTVGVNAILAQTTNTCLAREYRAPICHVRSCIGRADDILTGTSYYIAEVEALLELVRASAGSDPHLFVLDELFRGTNAVERSAAGQAVLTQLLEDASRRTKPHFVLAATHDLELVELASGRYEPYHFGDSVGRDGLVFDHRLQRGPSSSRNAIALLRLHGAPDALITRAMATAAMLDEQRARMR